MVGFETPGDFELAEVLGGDLGQRRVARVPQIAAIGRPLSVPGASLPVQRGCRPPRQCDERQNQPETPALPRHVAILSTQRGAAPQTPPSRRLATDFFI